VDVKLLYTHFAAADSPHARAARVRARESFGIAIALSGGTAHARPRQHERHAGSGGRRVGDVFSFSARAGVGGGGSDRLALQPTRRYTGPPTFSGRVP